MSEGSGLAVGDTILCRLDRRPIADVEGEIRAFMVVRNEIDRLPASLAHHRSLGVGRFFVVDNGSVDGAVDYLLGEPDVHVFHTLASYQRARNGIDWVESLLHGYGLDRWCLVLDGDEHLVYPDFHSLRLPALCGELSGRGLNCLATLFIDLYRGKAITRSVSLVRSKTFGWLFDRSAYYFDRSGYYNLPSTGSCLPRVFGGPRARLFWPEVDLGTYGARVDAYVQQGFDERAYLDQHRDVSEAVTAGELCSGWDHFVRYGHNEGRAVRVRHVPDWPEGAYLRQHPDVRKSVDAGVLSGGLEHYVCYGQFEGRLLWESGPPCLSQVPLFRWSRQMRLDVGRHRLSGALWRRRDSCGGALMHFKLTADFDKRATVAAAGSGDANAPWFLENQRYTEALQRNPNLSAFGPLSLRFQDARQLVELGILAPLDEL